METNFADDDELIIVNDCSTDNTAEILYGIQKKYPETIIINHSQNKGGASARNTAIENSSKELLFCLDSDNVLEKKSVAPLKNELINKKADIASFQDMRYFSSKNCHETNYIWRFLPNTTIADFMADHKNPGSSGNYLFTKNSWLKANGYPEFAGALDTWGFCFRQLATGSKLISLPRSYYFHRFGAESYYVRDAGRNNMSLMAFEIIRPFQHLIDPEDFEYITSEENKLNWFENFDSRPIRIAGRQLGKKAQHINVPPRYTVYNLVSRIQHKLKKTLRIT